MAMTGGYVYAIAIEGTPLVKIGRAQNIERRLRELQAAAPHRLIVHAVRLEDEPGRAVHGLASSSTTSPE
jgi:hypothetical protein